MRPIKEIIVHCTATRPEWWATKSTGQKVAEIRRWHVSERGWRDIGYHYLIDRNGTIATGRPLEQIGAHTQGRNTGSIGIALFGGHGSAETDQFSDHFTGAQDKALRDLIARLQTQFGQLRISGHNEYAAKACPGFQVGLWLDRGARVGTPIPVVDAQPPATGTESPWAAILRALAGIFKGGRA